MADRSGYIGRAPGDSAVIIARQEYTPSGVTTDFTFNSTYTVGYIDAYLNGARLIEASDYTATDGNTVSLTTAAGDGDVLELVAYKAFNATNVTNAAGNFTVGNDLTVSGNVNISGVTTLGAGSSVSYATTSFGLDGTPDITVNNLTAGFGTITSDLAVTGNVTVGGTLTYENLTNQDVLGLATYRSGLNVGSTEGSGAGVAVTITPYGNAYFGRTGIVTASTLNVTSAAVSDLTNNRVVTAGTAGELEDSANLTFNGETLVVGSGVTLNATGIFVKSGISTLGIVTGATYYGDGSNLEGVSSSGGAVLDITACLFI